MARLLLASVVLVPLLWAPSRALQITGNKTTLNVSENVNASLVKLSSDPTEPEITAGSRIAAGANLSANASANATGNPWLAASLQFSLTQALEPVKQKLTEIREWLITKLTELQDALKKVDEMPAVALTEFSTRVSDLFTALKEKLEPVTSKLAIAGPMMKTVEQVLDAAGKAGAADKLGEVASEISEQIKKYQETLSDSAKVALELKALGHNDWHAAGPKIQHLKELLDKGTTKIKEYNEVLKEKLHQALELLSSKLEVSVETFQPVEGTVSQAIDEYVGAVTLVDEKSKSAMEQLPAEVTALPSRAVKCMVAAGATILTMATLAL